MSLLKESGKWRWCERKRELEKKKEGRKRSRKKRKEKKNSATWFILFFFVCFPSIFLLRFLLRFLLLSSQPANCSGGGSRNGVVGPWWWLHIPFEVFVPWLNFFLDFPRTQEFANLFSTFSFDLILIFLNFFKFNSGSYSSSQVGLPWFIFHFQGLPQEMEITLPLILLQMVE